MIELTSTITCPACGHRRTETMPTDACQYFYECESCGVLLKPLTGDCCVFCSYGDHPCPPKQRERRSGARPEPFTGCLAEIRWVRRVIWRDE